MVLKYIAYVLIIMGSLFTIGSIIIIFSFDGWLDVLLGLIFFGPVPLIIGLYILRYIKTKINVTVINKFR